jgi:phage baseplate assembly protein V
VSSDIERVARRILQLVGVGRLQHIDDSGVQQKVQIQISAGGPGELEEVLDGAPRIAEYGLASSPPIGSEAIVAFVSGRRSMAVVIGTGHRPSRPTGLQPGEAMLYNGVAGSWVKMDAAGVMHANCDVLVDHKLTADQVVVQSAATGTFTSADGKTITVTKGIVTKII